MPHRLVQQRVTLSDVEWPFHASPAISQVDELLVVVVDIIKVIQLKLFEGSGQARPIATKWWKLNIAWYWYTPWVKKVSHPNYGYTFVNSWSIYKIISLLQRQMNCQQNSY